MSTTWKEIKKQVCEDNKIDHLDIEFSGHHIEGFHPETGMLLVDWNSRTGTVTIYYK